MITENPQISTMNPNSQPDGLSPIGTLPLKPQENKAAEVPILKTVGAIPLADHRSLLRPPQPSADRATEPSANPNIDKAIDAALQTPAPLQETQGQIVDPKSGKERADQYAEFLDKQDKQQNLMTRLGEKVVANAGPDDLRKTIIAYADQDGNLGAIAEKFPNNDVVKAVVDEIYQDRVKQKGAIEAFQTNVANMGTENIQKAVREYHAQYHDAPNLLPPEQVAQLKTQNPEAFAAYQQELETIKLEAFMDSRRKGVSFAVETFSDPAISDKTKQEAQMQGKLWLQELAEKTNPEDSQAVARLMEQAKALGIEDFDPTKKGEQMAVELNKQPDLKVETDQETGFDVLNFLGLRDQDGNILKGKATLFGCMALLFLMSDSMIAKMSGQQSLLSSLVEISHTGEQVYYQYLAFKGDPRGMSYMNGMHGGYGPRNREWFLGYDRYMDEEEKRRHQQQELTRQQRDVAAQQAELAQQQQQPLQPQPAAA
ncbi:MAG TPA: hypothetical protein VD999_02345 [Vitreimonas sp.]|nr:hypothetical protein [Vitreimonas sp.]